MIKVSNLNKKYNKGKRNEIHVINDISLEFPKTGLVCLLGPSGSGKSTLLNAIGGLDKVDNGIINIDGKEIKKYRSRQWDELRSSNFGYIFQNYILFPELSVYDNIKFSLQLSNIVNEEIDERIEYALRAVKMEKFKRRKARNLSGGQQQRVAIARALVTSPNVIIADEPTGNLDAVNSTQIMNIIKKISQECLVILVTHNTNLAYFYADRIIELKDGRIISDYENKSSGNLSFKQDQNIYLQDYQKLVIADENINLGYFYNKEHPKVDIKVIFKDNTFYITADSESSKIKFLTPGDEIKVIDAKKKGITQTEVDDFEYYLEKISHRKKRRLSVVPFKEAIKMAFARMRGLRRFQKLLLSSFILSSILIIVFVATLMGTLKINPNRFESIDRHLIGLQIDKSNENFTSYVDDILALKDTHSIKHFTAQHHDNSIELIYDKFLQFSFRGYSLNLYGSFVDLDMVSQKDVILGDYPTKINEILVDEVIVEQALNRSEFKSMGYTRYEDFINHEFNYRTKKGIIVGITKTKNPTIYINNLFKYSQIYNYTLDEENELYVTSYQGVLNNNEVLIKEDNHLITELNLDGTIFKIVGTFSSSSNSDLVISKEGLERLEVARLLRGNNLAIYSTNSKETLDFFSSNKNFKAVNLYDENLKNYRIQNAAQLSAQMIFAVIVLSGTLLLLYFMIRSSMIKRIYEIGVYRSLGVPKKDIYKIFGVEITLITLFTSVLGWMIVSYIFLKSLKSLEYAGLYYSWPLAFVILLGLWGINLLIGLLPVGSLLRKTPSEILTKYDI